LGDHIQQESVIVSALPGVIASAFREAISPYTSWRQLRRIRSQWPLPKLKCGLYVLRTDGQV
jgi:hypothetical protein